MGPRRLAAPGAGRRRRHRPRPHPLSRSHHVRALHHRLPRRHRRGHRPAPGHAGGRASPPAGHPGGPRPRRGRPGRDPLRPLDGQLARRVPTGPLPTPRRRHRHLCERLYARRPASPPTWARCCRPWRCWAWPSCWWRAGRGTGGSWGCSCSGRACSRSPRGPTRCTCPVSAPSAPSPSASCCISPSARWPAWGSPARWSPCCARGLGGSPRARPLPRAVQWPGRGRPCRWSPMACWCSPRSPSWSAMPAPGLSTPASPTSRPTTCKRSPGSPSTRRPARAF